MILKELLVSIRALAVLTLITGFLYPLAVTGIAQAFFPRQANGSLIVADGKPAGSRLIGQPFDDPKYFWSRPSATSPGPYNASASSGSNWGPLNPALIKTVADRVQALRSADPGNLEPIPVDLVTASASGLDPQITPAAALYQASRVARLRGLPRDQIDALIAQHTSGRWLGLFGEPAVNVLTLNLALDGKRG